jgi:hypothetical protein
MALTLQATIAGHQVGDIELALEEVTRLISEDYTSGFNSNDSGRFAFTLDGEEEPDPDEPDIPGSTPHDGQRPPA